MRRSALDGSFHLLGIGRNDLVPVSWGGHRREPKSCGGSPQGGGSRAGRGGPGPLGLSPMGTGMLGRGALGLGLHHLQKPAIHPDGKGGTDPPGQIHGQPGVDPGAT